MKRLMILTALLVLGALIPDLATAQMTDELGRYRKQAFSARFSFFGGLELMQGGAPADLGFFGGNYRRLFDQSEAALDAMGTYRALRISGTALWATGLAVLLAEIALLVADKDLFIEENGCDTEIKPLFWALLGGGGVIGITGGIMMQGANGYLSDAIERYNGDLAKRLRSRGADLGLPTAITLSYRSAF